MSNPLQVLCYNYLNVSTARWEKVGECLGTHRMQEKEMDTPELPL